MWSCPTEHKNCHRPMEQRGPHSTANNGLDKIRLSTFLTSMTSFARRAHKLMQWPLTPDVLSFVSTAGLVCSRMHIPAAAAQDPANHPRLPSAICHQPSA